ncbi:MAG: hypothetical protein CMN32_01395 [Saprospirales bacterium]|nr:hypothetical protein [Saprospirales bacterium]
MKRNSFLRPIIAFTLLAILMMPSCTKDFTTESLPGIQFSNSPPVCNFSVEEFSVFGESFSYYLENSFGYYSPDSMIREFLPTELQDTFNIVYDDLETAMSGMDLNSRLNYLLSNGLSSVNFNAAYLEIANTVTNGIAAQEGLDIIKLRVQSLEPGIESSTKLTCDEKEILRAMSEYVKSSLDYLTNIWGTNGERYQLFDGRPIEDRGCGFWTELGCFLGGVLEGWTTATGVIGIIKNVAGDLGISVVTTTIQNASIYIAAAKITYAIIFAILKDCCPVDCDVPMGASLRFTGCESAVYKAYGYGDDVVTLDWDNDGGIPSFITTMAPHEVEITQLPLFTLVQTTWTTHCAENGSENNSLNPFHRDLRTLAGAFGGIAVTGPKAVDPPSQHTYTYCNTDISLNANMNFQWFVQNGTIVNNYGHCIEVLWDADMTEGQVQLQARNNCSNAQQLFVLNVTDGGPIP